MSRSSSVLRTPLSNTETPGKSQMDAMNRQTEESHEISPGVRAWEKRVMAGIKRMNEDEAYRKEIVNKLP